MYKYLAIAILMLLISSCTKDGNDKIIIGNNGKGGSMARFAIKNNHLYVVDDSNLNIFDISDVQNPELVKKQEVGFGIETIFPRDNNLFLGSQSGMYVYDITNPELPNQLSFYNHITSCDPVVVEGNLAYVTLRTGGSCQTGFTDDQLDIIDISDLENPTNLVIHPMPTPYGLSVEDSTLFICQGDSGLSIFNSSDIYNLQTIAKYTNIKAYDVITNNGVLIVIGDDGLHQYNYSDLNNITLLSEILVGE
jgi:hypothetical protein